MQVIGDRYEVLGVIGRGGQSVVYRARDMRDGDLVAIKLVHGAAGDPDATERIFREIQSMSRLRGGAVVRVLHQVRTPEGALGLVMDLLDGEELEVFLARKAAASERVDPAWVVRTFAPIVETLDEAHGAGFVHRDLKPENVFLMSEAAGGGAKILDFGFVKLMRAPSITGAEAIAGSPSYIAPELWLGGAVAADPRADVYSLAVVLFRTLGGRPPFEGSFVELMQAATTGERPSLHALRPDLSPDVDHWVRQSMAAKPDERFQGVKGMWRALVGCLESPAR